MWSSRTICRSRRSLPRHPFIASLLSLKLAPADFAIFGSAPMLAHGLREDVSDLDIVARGAAWRRALRLPGYSLTRGPHSNRPMLRFFGGNVEISTHWTDDSWNVDELIDTAEVIGGLRFVQLREVLSYKRTLRRDKDRRDIAAVERYLFGSLPTLVRTPPKLVPCAV